MSIQLTQFGSVKSFTSNRVAHCKNCYDKNMDKTKLMPGEKRISLSASFNRTLYLCPPCASFQVERLEALVSDLKRAINGWIDTEAEFYETQKQFEPLDIERYGKKAGWRT
jgi:hypothetical protein